MLSFILHVQELFATLNENSRLEAKVQQLENELRNQLKAHKKGMEDAEVTINSLLKRQSEDKEAISGFMSQVQELRSANTLSNAKLSSQRQEVEDSERELCSATAKIDLLTLEVESHRAELDKQSKQHQREMKKKESEVGGEGQTSFPCSILQNWSWRMSLEKTIPYMVYLTCTYIEYGLA